MDALNNRGVVYAQLGRFDEAIQDLTRVIENNPQNGYAYFIRGVAYYGTSAFEKALADWDRFENLGGRLPDSFSQMRAEVEAVLTGTPAPTATALSSS